VGSIASASNSIARLDKVRQPPLIYPYWHQSWTAKDRLGHATWRCMRPIWRSKSCRGLSFSGRLPAEAGLTPAIAGEALDTIGKLAKTRTPAAGAASQAQLNVITQLSGVIPWPPDDPLQAVVAPAKLENTRKVIRQLSDQIKAKANLK
jgi:hypothetical protein